MTEACQAICFAPDMFDAMGKDGLLSDDDSRPAGVGGDGKPRTDHVIQKEDMTTNLAEPVAEEATAKFPELSAQLEKDLVQVFKLLSDETRLRILMYLAREGELHVTALCDRLGQSQPAVSHHLALLRVAGIIEARRDGKHNFYSIRRTHFHRIMGELFQSINSAGADELRFDDFVLTQENN
jgi:ArsR family transcriptional regulator, arsenate/arsenite/antimonite-responsive transcriptional repressor